MTLIEEWGLVLRRSATTWTTAILTFLVGALANTYLAAFAVIGFMPSPWLQFPLAGFVGLIVIGGPIILSRLIEQPKLREKLDVSTSAPPSSSCQEGG